MNVNFYLSSTGLIMASFTFGKERLRVSTGDKVNKLYWDQDKQRAAESSQYDGAELNFKLKQLDAWFYNEHRRQVNNGSQVTAESIRAAFLDHMGRDKKEVRSFGLIEFIPEFLKTAKTKKGQLYTENTRLVYERMFKHLKDFQVSSGYQVDFDTINRKFYDKFVAYLRTQVRKDTSVGCYIRPLKHVLNVALKSGLTSSTEHLKEYFVTFMEDSEQEALTAEEITAIYNKEISDPYRAYLRDLFVLSCHTGLRYSDWSNYKPENLIENGTVLRAFTKKTKETVFIPLHPRARVILSRIFKSVYPMPCGSDFDRIIKVIVKSCGINTDRTKTFTYDGISKSIVVNRGDMISSHSGRRSFVTNAVRGEVPQDAIMRITGHKTEKIFKQYVRIEKLESAHRLMGHKFFSE